MSVSIVIGKTTEGQPLRLDIPSLIDTRALIQGNSGAGKSRLLRRIAEQAHGQVQLVILDPEGEFSTLRERYDFLLVGKAGEVPAEPRAAGLLARRLLELRVSAVVDLYDLRLDARREFVRQFLEALLALPKELYRPLIVALDEAHLFVPERSAGESVATESVIALMSQGRKRGLCGILLTQRLSKLHKDAAAECNNVLIGRTWLDVDQKRAADALGLPDREKQKLRELEAGEFLGFGPAFSEQGMVRFRGGAVETTHPTAGQRHKLEPPGPSAAIRKVLDELKDLPQQAAEEIRTLQAAQARIRELERQAKQRPAAAAAPPPAKPKVLEHNVPMLKGPALAKLTQAIKRAEGLGYQLREAAQDFTTAGREIGEQLVASTRAYDRYADAVEHLEAGVPHRKPQSQGAASVPGSSTRAAAGAAPIARRSAAAAPRPAGSEGLSGPAQRILDALAELEALGVGQAGRMQVALFSGYTNLNSKGFVNATGALRSAGNIQYGNGTIALTEAGRALAGACERPRTEDELHARVIGMLGGATARVLKPLLSAYPESLAREDVGREAGYTNLNSKGLVTLGRLRSLGLISYPSTGQVAATSLLFLS